jgi:RNA polymerase sigma-70 factor (sigma-E family)
MTSRRVLDEEFAEFARGAAPRLLKAAWLICGDPHQAEDLVQSAMVKVYLKWSRLRDGSPLAYARRCLLTTHIDTHRRTGRETAVAETPDLGSWDRSWDDTDEVVRLLAELPLRERQVVVMRHYAGLPEAHVAELLGISLGTVKSSASRGLAKLRQALHPTVDASEDVRSAEVREGNHV